LISLPRNGSGRLIKKVGVIIFSALLLLFSASAFSIDIAGDVHVIDADTLKIGTQVIRLYGIDAPENGQSCINQTGKRYSCGAVAEEYLSSLARDKATCTGTEFDNYQRLIAICSSGGVELNRQLVLEGYALAFRKYSDTYVDEENIARSASLGLWNGTFESPWDFRAKQWQAAGKEAPKPDCPIKGNINSKGEKIYHAPWSRSYKQTRINTQKEERWFCSEAEALAAGWRAPLR
jgi:endonuclease YncB( thermonuclease family)